jgi:hypothetical protein
VSWLALRAEVEMIFRALSVPCFWEQAAMFVGIMNDRRRYAFDLSAKQVYRQQARKQHAYWRNPEASRERVRAVREERVARGLCASCLVVPVTGGHVTCRNCRSSISAAAKKRLAAQRREAGCKERKPYKCGRCKRAGHSARTCPRKAAA